MARNLGGTTADKISIANASPINITGTAFSLSAWLKKADTGTRRYVCGKSGASASPYAYGLRVDASNQIVGLIDDGTAVYENAASTTSVAANTWYHVLMVKNGTGAGALKLYVNGSLEGTSNSNVSLVSNSNALVFGYRDVAATSEIWSGVLAEPAIWNTALDATDASNLAAGKSPFFVKPGNLAFYAPFLGVDSPERDVINGNNGTLTGTSQATHPTIVYPPVRQLSPIQAVFPSHMEV